MVYCCCELFPSTAFLKAAACFQSLLIRYNLRFALHPSQSIVRLGKASIDESFTETLQTWQNFYFMIFGVVQRLLGLMFVALSLGMHLVSDETREEFEIFVTPSVVYSCLQCWSPVNAYASDDPCGFSTITPFKRRIHHCRQEAAKYANFCLKRQGDIRILSWSIGSQTSSCPSEVMH